MHVGGSARPEGGRPGNVPSTQQQGPDASLVARPGKLEPVADRQRVRSVEPRETSQVSEDILNGAVVEARSNLCKMRV